MSIAFYLRVSKKEKTESLSQSLEHQKLLLEEWRSRENLETERIEYYIDDGYSGLGKKRPSYELMIARCLLGKIHMVVVKDFSRLARDHLLLATLREELFPSLQIRLVSLGDYYDSEKKINELSVSLQSIFYEYYCHDISRKVKLALDTKKQEGYTAVAKAPFGYRKGTDNSFVICEEEAEMIRRIFALSSGGMSCSKIGKIMGMDSARIWNILHNPVYGGTRVWHKFENYPGLKHSTKYLPRNQWCYQVDYHPAIVDKNQIMTCDEKDGTNRKKGPRHIFHGITKCMDCNRALCHDRRKTGWLCCNHCFASEKKVIRIETLWKICSKQLKCLSEGQFSEPEGINDRLREYILHEFIHTIRISSKGSIQILWNFKEE